MDLDTTLLFFGQNYIYNNFSVPPLTHCELALSSLLPHQPALSPKASNEPIFHSVIQERDLLLDHLISLFLIACQLS